MIKKEDNAEYILNTEDPNFEEDLKNLSAKVIFLSLFHSFVIFTYSLK